MLCTLRLGLRSETRPSSSLQAFAAKAALRRAPSRHVRSVRHISSESSPRSWVRSNSRISTVFGVLIALGVGSTAYGLYEFYTAFTLWPEEVRADLRAGIKAKHQGELFTSERYLRRAWETALGLDPARFKADPLLKLSGIAIALAEVLEAEGKPQPAYDVYAAAHAALQAAPARSPAERMRGVALAARLGEMAETYQQPPEEEERWLTCAVEELLRVLRDQRAAEGLRVDGGGAADAPVVLAELELPSWVSRTDVGAPLEALGRFYSRQENVQYAIPLYLQAISLLVPPASAKRRTTTEEKCRGAELMNNLSELSLRGPPTPEKRDRAEQWARQALSTIERTKASAAGDADLTTCETALAAVLFNLGSLLEMGGDFDKSRDFYQASWDQSKRIRMKEGILEAQVALRRLERASKRDSTTMSSNAGA
ncbi:hypothetical protein B0H21DRAFT_326380 [Amylocystis lapponica]|nr:hypothetical protein B0H21DRAFT_326380 [Amylocystis lapponica]